MNPAQQTAALGQSLWLDNLSRSLIREGVLARHIAEHAITGVTSNPSIFQNALATSPYYADDLARLRNSEADAERRYEALAIPDIQAACDLLDPVYARSGGQDGYVSLEVAPRWAYDAGKTVEEARRLSATVTRRNLLVKVPGTPEGISAFESLTALGINVNVTLLFSLAQTQAVFDAYLRGVEARAAAGHDITGIDPAYEGSNPRVIKDYFTPDTGLCADGIILRHVLEHVPDPFAFLCGLRDANGGRGLIYIEVPCLDWIALRRAWFDIFYEHVNYFRLADFPRMFGSVAEAGHLFAGQYLYVVADLASLRSPRCGPRDTFELPAGFCAAIDESRAALTVGNGAAAVWGGASKAFHYTQLMAHEPVART